MTDLEKGSDRVWVEPTPSDYPSPGRLIMAGRSHSHSWASMAIAYENMNRDILKLGVETDKYAKGHELGTFSAPIHVGGKDRKPLTNKQKKSNKRKRRLKKKGK